MKMDLRFRGHEFRNHPLSRARFEPRFSPVAVCLFILKSHANHFRISSAGYNRMAHFVASNATEEVILKTGRTRVNHFSHANGAEPGLGGRESRWQRCGLSLQLPRFDKSVSCAPVTENRGRTRSSVPACSKAGMN
jgi:hypothetical protein